MASSDCSHEVPACQDTVRHHDELGTRLDLSNLCLRTSTLGSELPSNRNQSLYVIRVVSRRYAAVNEVRRKREDPVLQKGSMKALSEAGVAAFHITYVPDRSLGEVATEC